MICYLTFEIISFLSFLQSFVDIKMSRYHDEINKELQLNKRER